MIPWIIVGYLTVGSVLSRLWLREVYPKWVGYRPSMGHYVGMSAALTLGWPIVVVFRAVRYNEEFWW